MVSKFTQNYCRPFFDTFLARLREPRQFIQILAGPRQVGKTTLIQQLKQEVESKNPIPFLYISVDEAISPDRAWIETQWARGRRLCPKGGASEAILAIDEIQKIKDWGAFVKALWDHDTLHKIPLKIILLGSSPLQIHKGSSESLAGRFEILYATHWSYQEMRDCFQFDLEDYLYFGGYPGAAPLIHDQNRWQRYIRESLIEVTISHDILAMSRIDKPALLKQLFYLSCEYSGQILSYTKMMGQLQDAGNTTTLAHYLDLLARAGLVVGLGKWSTESVRTRASSPKLITLNPALFSCTQSTNKNETLANPELKGQLVENAVGAYLWNQSLIHSFQLFYWNEGHKEVDFILTYQKKTLAIEVKSGTRKTKASGLQEFCKRNPKVKPLIVGTGGIPLEEFFLTPPLEWL